MSIRGPESREFQWLFYAIASGACAALNGALAKLTTTQLTHTWASHISNILLGAANNETTGRTIEILIRGSFFGMNLIFNGIMWGLFTKALTLASSTVRVSVINTSANFVVAAVIGLVVFREELSAMWWCGAALLIAGSVIIGQREQVKEDDVKEVTASHENAFVEGENVRTTGREQIDNPGTQTRSKNKRAAKN